MRFIPLIIIFLLIGGMTLWFVSGPQTTPTPVVSKDQNSPKTEKPKKSSNNTEEPVTTDFPRAVADQLEHDFGFMKQFSQGEHIFVIKNEGSGDLELTQGPSSCSCTVLGLADNKIPPGGEAKIKLNWETRRKQGFFAQEATVLTNDPEQEAISFRIKGIIETTLAMSPSKIVLSTIPLGKEITAEAIVFSKTSNSMKDFEFSFTGNNYPLKHEFVDLPEEELEKIGALSAKKIRITLPAIEEEQNINYNCKIKLTLEDKNLASTEGLEKNKQVLSFNLEGKVKGGFKIISPLIFRNGLLDIGDVKQGENKKVRVSLKIQDGEKEFNVTKINTIPEFVKVKVFPDESKHPGLYVIEVEIPKDAPKCVYRGNHGAIHIYSDHPRIPYLKAIGLQFTVQ